MTRTMLAVSKLPTTLFWVLPLRLRIFQVILYKKDHPIIKMVLGCAVHCHSQGDRVSVVANETQCFCMKYLQYDKLVTHQDCMDFYLAGKFQY